MAISGVMGVMRTSLRECQRVWRPGLPLAGIVLRLGARFVGGGCPIGAYALDQLLVGQAMGERSAANFSFAGRGGLMAERQTAAVCLGIIIGVLIHSYVVVCRRSDRATTIALIVSCKRALPERHVLCSLRQQVYVCGRQALGFRRICRWHPNGGGGC